MTSGGQRDETRHENAAINGRESAATDTQGQHHEPLHTAPGKEGMRAAGVSNGEGIMNQGMLKMTVLNKNVIPNVLMEVRHCGRNDYRVIIAGIGEHSQHHQFGPATGEARRLSRLDQENLNYYLANVQNRNDAQAEIRS